MACTKLFCSQQILEFAVMKDGLSVSDDYFQKLSDYNASINSRLSVDMRKNQRSRALLFSGKSRH